MVIFQKKMPFDRLNMAPKIAQDRPRTGRRRSLSAFVFALEIRLRFCVLWGAAWGACAFQQLIGLTEGPYMRTSGNIVSVRPIYGLFQNT